MRILLASVLAAMVGSVASAQPPSGVPPTLDVVHQINQEKGTIQCKRTTIVMELRTVEEKVVVGGQEQTVTKTISVPISKVIQFEFNIPTSRVITVEGKQLPIDDVWKRLKTNTAIAVSGDGNPPSAAFLRALNPNILVLIPAPPKNVPMPK